MNTPASFKSLSKDGTLKKTDLFRVQLSRLSVEPGFNLREEGDDLREHIEALCSAIMSGDPLPPMEVRVADDGRVLVVDGHCRRRAYLMAVDRGAEIEWVDVLPFRGNDADRVARIITSAAGKPLTPLEVAMGYKRLAGYGWTPEQIAAKFSKTRQHVDQGLILANANTDVHQLVREGKVAASVAVDAVRKHGEAAGVFLAGKVTAAGGKKATGGQVRGRSLPRQVVEDVVGKVEAFAQGVPPSERAVIFGKSDIPGATVVLPAAMVRELIAAQTSIADARDKQAERERAKAMRAAQVEADL